MYVSTSSMYDPSPHDPTTIVTTIAATITNHASYPSLQHHHRTVSYRRPWDTSGGPRASTTRASRRPRTSTAATPPR